MAALRSRRPGGLHLYYSDTQSRGNTRFEVYGCKGDIRSTGYIILWHDGADLLADALTDPIARSRSWPVDLFDAAGLGAVTEPDGAKCGSTWLFPVRDPAGLFECGRDGPSCYGVGIPACGGRP